MLNYDNTKYISELFLKTPKYFLPLAAFFLLISTAITNILLIFTIISAIVIFFKKRDYRISLKSKIIRYSLLIYISLILSFLYTTGNEHEIIDSLKKYIKFLYIPLIFYYTSIYKNENLIISYFIKGSFLILCLSYLKYFSILDFEAIYDFLEYANIATIKSKIVLDVTGIFQNYLIQGIIFSFLSFICFILAKRNNSFFLYMISALSFINIVFLNNSRTAYILVFSLLAIILFKYIKINKLITFVGAACILLILTYTNIGNNFFERVERINTDIELISNDNFNSSVGKRFIWTKTGIDNIKNRPIFGYGVGSYKAKIEDYILINSINIDASLIVTNNPHSEFVSISTQLGLFGLALFIMFLISLYKEADSNFLAYGIFSTVAISSLFNSAFYDNILGIFIIIIISLSYIKIEKIKI